MFSYALLLLFFPAVMIFAAASDLLTMTISNRLSIALVLGFFAAAYVVDMSLANVGWHLLAALAVLTVAFGCFSFGWIGGGDAKLAAAISLWFGFAHLTDYLVLAALLGGALTLIILGARYMPLPSLLLRQPWIARLHAMNSGVPYGIALAAAGLMIYPDTDYMRFAAFVRAFGI